MFVFGKIRGLTICFRNQLTFTYQWNSDIINCKIAKFLAGIFQKRMRAASRISSLFHAVSWTFSPILFSSQVYSSISMFNIRFLCYRMPCLVCNIVGSLLIPDKRVNWNICATVSNCKQFSWNDRKFLCQKCRQL